MNRTQAAALLDELLALERDVAVEGRCPKCEALFEIPEGSIVAGRINHAEWCPVTKDDATIDKLRLKYGFHLETASQLTEDPEAKVSRTALWRVHVSR